MTDLDVVADLFHNYRLESLDLDRHAALVIRTVLAQGSWDQVRWLFARYGWAAVEAQFRVDLAGCRSLPRDALAFWQNVFMPDQPPTVTADPRDRWRPTRPTPDPASLGLPPELDRAGATGHPAAVNPPVRPR